MRTGVLDFLRGLLDFIGLLESLRREADRDALRFSDGLLERDAFFGERLLEDCFDLEREFVRFLLRLFEEESISFISASASLLASEDFFDSFFVSSELPRSSELFIGLRLLERFGEERLFFFFLLLLFFSFFDFFAGDVERDRDFFLV